MTTDLHRMYAIGIMAFIIFLSSLVSLPVLPQLSADLGAATYQIPIVISAALATVVIAQFFAGALADRYSRQRLILIGTFLGAISSLLCLIANTWIQLAALRVLGGIADAISMPALLAITSTLGKDTPGKFFGILRSSQGLSFVIGPALGSALSVIALRAPFLVDGILSLVAFCAAFFLIKGQDRASSDHNLGVFRSLHKTFSNKAVLIYLLLGFAALFAFGILSSFVPTQAKLIGLQAWEIGLIFATGSIAFSLSSYFVGTISDQKRRKPIVIFSLFIMIISGLSLIFANSFETLLICYIVFSTSEAIPYLLSFVYASETFESHYIGTAMGAFDSLMDLSLLIAPLLGIAALGITDDMTYPFIIATLPVILALIVSIGWLQDKS